MNQKVLLVGAGGYGAGYAQKLIEGIPGAEFAGIVDPFADKSSAWNSIAESGVPVCDTLDEFFASHAADTAVIAAPIPFHEEYAVSLLERGLNLLLEKPVAATMEQAERIRAARDRSGRILAVGFQWCYDPAMRVFKKDVAAGVYGAPKRLRAIVNWPRAHSYYSRGTGWAGKAYDGKGRPIFDSIAMNATAHYLENMLWIAGSPIAKLEAETARAYPVETYDTAVLRATLRNGATAFFAASHVTQQTQNPMFVYEFERGTAYFGGRNLTEGNIVVRDGAGRVLKDYGFSQTQNPVKLARFLETTRANQAPDCTLEDAMLHLSAIERMRSACPEACTLSGFKEKDDYRFVPGLSRRLFRCFDECRMPGELGGWTDGGVHAKFHYSSLDDVKTECGKVGVSLPLSDDLSPLASPIKKCGIALPNRIAVQPMEGADGDGNGTPGELTNRRYLRFAEGGAGLIWFEAVAIAPEVRSSPRQLMLTRENLDAYKRLIGDAKEASLRKNGFAPLFIMQLNVSGRYSKPEGVPAPRVAYNCRVLEDTPLAAACIVSDDELKRYEALSGAVARLAEEAGFDGVDVKACHRYLASELLSAYDRPGEYGGSFDNRIRFLMNSVAAAKSALSSAFVTTRMNAYDGFEYPFGFGVNPGRGLEPDFSEAKELAKRLVRAGEPMLNVTIGNPYKNPHVNRPYDAGNYVPDEHPLIGVSRLMDAARAIREAAPDAILLASGFSYLRQFSSALAAGMVGEGGCDVAGFGRLALADPGFPNEIFTSGAIDPAKVCMTCGGCARLLRAGRPSGCLVRDRELYRAGGDK